MSPLLPARRFRAGRRTEAATALAVATLLSGCAGGAPLLHPAQVLRPGRVSVGAGVMGNIGALDDVKTEGSQEAEQALDDFAVGPGVSPWAAGRVGIVGDNEAGITYAGRSFRLDFRHAFEVGPLFLSLGAGGSALIPRPLGGDADLGSVYGGGGDVPVLLGWVSTAELYSVWFGPRGGFDILRGSALESEVLKGGRTDTFIPFEGTHGYVGGLLGAKVGFRTFHVALEVDISYHFANGTFGEASDTEASIGQLTVSPAGALILTL